MPMLMIRISGGRHMSRYLSMKTGFMNDTPNVMIMGTKSHDNKKTKRCVSAVNRSASHALR
jgi:hypothetical protein